MSDGDLVMRIPAEAFEELRERLTNEVVAEARERLRLDGEPYMDSKQAADYLACKPQRIHELVHKGRLPHHKDGSRLLFRRAELDNYLATSGPAPR